MTAAEISNGDAQAAADRENFIPIRKTDILDALIEHDRLASEDERAKLIGGMFLVPGVRAAPAWSSS